MGVIAAVDCGSTNLKAALFDESLIRLGERSAPVSYAVQDAVCVEFDPESLWVAFQDLMRALPGAAGVRASDISVVAFGSQAQTFALLDGRGRPVTPFFSWMDRRAQLESDEIGARFGAGFHAHCSFPGPVPELQAAKMRWVARHRGAEVGRAAGWCTVPGFLALRAAGVNAVDANLAAMSGLFSMASGGWWSEMAEFCGVSRLDPPELAAIGGRLAALAQGGKALGLGAGSGVVFAGNDQTAGAVGNGCREGEVLVTLGTALVAYRRAGPRPGPFRPRSCWGPYPGGGFYELATATGGCSALDWARREMAPELTPAGFDELAAQAEPGAGAVRFYPERMRTQGAWVGGGSREERARAVLEGVLFSLRNLLEEDLEAHGAGGVCAIGGGSRSAVWMQMAADILGVPVRRGRGDSLLGAAAIALGREVPAEREAGRFEPEARRAEASREAYTRWVRAAGGGCE